MADRKPPIPLDLSGHRDLPPAEIAPLLEKVGDNPEERALSTLTALLMNRALRLLRQGSRQEVLDEALMLNRFLALPAGARLKEIRPDAFGGWTALGELLSAAGRSSSRAAIPSILLGTRGRDVLELLASENRPCPRSEIKRRLDFKSESHLSHLLRDLEEADLIVRYRPEGGKEVLVERGPVGREVIETSILPAWLTHLVDLLGKTASGEPISRETAARDLEAAGAPSRIAAERLAEALAALSGAPVTEEPSSSDPEILAKILYFENKTANLKKDENHFDLMRDRQGDQRPGALFEIEEDAVEAM